jgi:hypothetical protein
LWISVHILHGTYHTLDDFGHFYHGWNEAVSKDSVSFGTPAVFETETTSIPSSTATMLQTQQHSGVPPYPGAVSEAIIRREPIVYGNRSLDN